MQCSAVQDVTAVAKQHAVSHRRLPPSALYAPAGHAPHSRIPYLILRSGLLGGEELRKKSGEPGRLSHPQNLPFRIGRWSVRPPSARRIWDSARLCASCYGTRWIVLSCRDASLPNPSNVRLGSRVRRPPEPVRACDTQSQSAAGPTVQEAPRAREMRWQWRLERSPPKAKAVWQERPISGGEDLHHWCF